MSQTVITSAFEQLKAQEAANGGVVILDEFVFAHVPNLDITSPIDRGEGLPDEALIVHRQAVGKTGMVNNNAVVYSVVMGADVGDFDFNWVGLVNSANNVVAMIVHAPTQKKIKTATGQQGNVLTRSFLMEYNGASVQTQIITPADTWQIDFTARLNAVDERIRKENIDIYGQAAFFGDGYQVVRSGAGYYVHKGAGYIAGLRSELLFNQDIVVTDKPARVWVDLCWQGTLTSTWDAYSQIRVAAELSDYIDGDEFHYVFAIADIMADGSVNDLRPVSAISELSNITPEENTFPYFDDRAEMKLARASEFSRGMMAKEEATELLEYLELRKPGGARHVFLDDAGTVSDVISWETPEKYYDASHGFDDTISVQRAIDAAGDGTVLFENRTYNITRLLISKSVTLRGQGKRSKTILKATDGSPGSLIAIGKGNAAPTLDNINLIGDWTDRGTLKNPVAPVSGPLNAIYIEQSDSYSVSVQLRDSTIVGFSGYGLYAKKSRNMGMLRYSSILSCAKQCVYLLSAVDWMFIDCSFGRSLTDGLYLNCDSVRMINCESYENQGKGIVMGPLATVSKLICNHINSNKKDGIHYDNLGGAESHVLVSNVFFANGSESLTEDDVIRNGYANIRVTSSVRLFKAMANGHFNYDDSQNKRVAYIFAAASTGSSTNWDASDDMINPVATGLSSQSAAIGVSNYPARVSWSDNGVEVRSSARTTTQKVPDASAIAYGVIQGGESKPRYGVSASGLYLGDGVTDPARRISWSGTKLYLDELGGQTVVYKEINPGAVFDVKNLPYEYYSLSSEDAYFTLPDASTVVSGFKIRFKKIVKSASYTIRTSAEQTIYGADGGGLSVVVLSDPGAYEFIWNSARRCWIAA